MKMNKTTIIATCAILLSATSFTASARTNIDFDIFIGNPPPPARHEVIPAPRAGNVWIPGFWDWNGRRHTWVRGHWERARTGYVYEKPQWQQTDRGWHLARGEWKQGRNDDYRMNHDRGNRHGNKHGRDRDHDGVPNRYDNDRDGDGVSNRFDDRPNNPRRN
jgi:hypothetical protein